MNLPWDIGEFFLSILAAVLMIFILAVSLGYVDQINTATRNDIQSANYQREFAKLQRFSGNDIAYTEVLNTIYTEASPTIPIVVVTETFWLSNSTNGIVDSSNVNNPLRFPFLIETFKNSAGVPAGDNFRPTGQNGVWTGNTPVGGVSNESQFRAISDWLAKQSRPNSDLLFSGRILRTDSGVPYLIVFTYRA